MNMFLHGMEDFEIIRDDTLRNPGFFEADGLKTFDCVIANPPFSLKEWGAESWANDPYGRNMAECHPNGNGDMAWVQHMIKSMNRPFYRTYDCRTSAWGPVSQRSRGQNT